MLQRFTGEDSRRFIVEALETQPVVGGRADLASAIGEMCSIHSWKPGDIILTEGDGDNHLLFLLAGTVSVLVRGRQVAVRKSGQHVGEMALLDPGSPRSATLVADDEVVAARISATAFREIADTHPALWRNLAMDLAGRLRQRNDTIGPVNEVSRIFLGCSSESLAVGEAVKVGLESSGFDVRVWTDGVFRPSTFALESLEAELARADFAALVLAPDDTVISREMTSPAPRDNVVFELGLFMGALGHSRTFLVLPEGSVNKVPSDLAGLTYVTYGADGAKSEVSNAVASACRALAEAMRSSGPR